MDNERINNDPGINNRQPSIRELANEHMRERVRAAKEAKLAARGESSEDRTERRERRENTVSVRNERTEKSERTEKRERPERRERIERTDRADVPARSERTEKSERPVRSERAEKTDRAERSERPVRSERTERPEKNERVRTSEKPAHTSRRVEDAKKANVKAEPRKKSANTNRPAAKDAVETERELLYNRINVANGKARPRTSSINTYDYEKNRNKKPVFWIGLGIYTAVLIALAVAFLIYTDVCLKKYEKSQSENYMISYMDEFESKAKSNGFTPADFSFSNLDMKFVNTDTLLGDYIDSLSSYSSFEAVKDPTSYVTEAPVFNIMADGQMIAKITLKAVNQTKLFAILTVMDWDVDSIEPVCSITVTDYTILAPEGYTPVIDGVAVDTTYQTGNKENMPGFENISQYVSLPQLLEYKVQNVLEESDVKVLNPSGEEVPCTIKGNVVTASYSIASSAGLTDERKEEALGMVQTYEDFLTSDLSGANHGLATVQAFLIKDSDYWNLAKQWATGVDITFTSAHTFDNPKYSNVVVDNYCEYSENCYSLHISYNKNMILTRTKEKQTNDFDSTVFFVYVDDSDDGVNNPHWCIADMIATTK